MAKSRTENTLTNAGMGILVRIARMIVNFIIKTLFIRCLGAQYTGISSLFTDILMLLSFAELGIGSAITFALYKPVADNNQTHISKIMNFYRIAYQKVAISVFCGGIILIPFLKYIVKDVPDISENIYLLYFLYVLNTSTTYILSYRAAIFEAKQKRAIVSQIEIIVMFLRLLLEGIVLLTLKKFILYLLIEIFLNIFQNYIIYKLSNKEYDYKNKKVHIDSKEKKKMLSDIGALAMYQIAFVVLSSTDSIIVSSMINTETVGFLSCYKMIFNQIISFLQQFIYGGSASVGNLVTEENIKSEFNLFCDLNFLFFAMSNFCCCCLFVLCESFISIWVGKEYLLGYAVVGILTLDFFLSIMLQVVTMFRTANGIFIQGRFRPVIMALINVILSFVLVIPYGVAGVLFATIISKCLTEIWYDPWLIYRLVFKAPVKYYYYRVIMYLLSVLLTCLLSFKVCFYIKMSYWIGEILLKIFVCFILSSIVVVLLWSRSSEFQSCLIRVKKLINAKRGGR